MRGAEPGEPRLVELDAGLSRELVGEQAAAHADLAMDAPDREFEPLRVERLFPGEHVLVDAVDQRAVEVEQEDGFDAHGLLVPRRRDRRPQARRIGDARRAVMLCAS